MSVSLSDIIKFIGNALKTDYIVSQETDSNDWFITRFNSGRLTATKKEALTVTLTSATGGSYGVASGIALPSGLKTTPKIWLTSNMGGNQFVSLGASYITLTKFNIAVSRHFSTTVSNLHYVAYIESTWK